MTRPKFKYALHKFHIGWILIGSASLLGLLTISIFIEVPEFFKWGFELGYFLFPIFSSILISILIYFFTSHIKDTETEFDQFDQFEFLRETIIDILKTCHVGIGNKSQLPKFQEKDLTTHYSLELTEKDLNQPFWNSILNRQIDIRKHLSLLIKSCHQITNSNRLHGLDSNFHDLLSVFNYILPPFTNESDISEESINSLIVDLIFLLSRTNSEILNSKDYQKYYFLKKDKEFKN